MILANYHTHSTFCDGKNTPEEIVLAAIDRGFSAIGFSSHGYTPFDLRYCMKDTDGYLREIRRLKDVYKQKIQIYLGLEEDAHAPANRADFEYISAHLLSDCSSAPLNRSTPSAPTPMANIAPKRS